MPGDIKKKCGNMTTCQCTAKFTHHVQAGIIIRSRVLWKQKKIT